MTRVLAVFLLLFCLTHCGKDPDVKVANSATTDTHESPSKDVGQPGGDSKTTVSDSGPGVSDQGPVLPDSDTGSEQKDTKPPEVTPAPVRYVGDRTHSPLTPYVAARAQAIRQASPDHAANVFMKVGDSISYSSKSMFCFGGDDIELGAFDSLNDTLAFYLEGDAAGSTPFDRKSQAVLGGKTASWALKGTPAPLVAEMDAISPSTAIVMFGTNDSGYHPTDTGKMLRWYGEAMFALVDTLITEGVMPVLMTIPPRTNKLSIGQLAPLVNAIVRGLAQGRQIPLVDYFREMLPLPDQGLSGDGVHPNVLASKKACHLTEKGLEYGYNMRNAVSLQALDRVRNLLADSVETWDEAPAVVAGSGSPYAPFNIDALPFTHMGDTSVSPYKFIDEYTGCDAAQDESGAEWYYGLHLKEQTALRLAILDHGTTDADIHVLDATGTGAGCLARNHTLIEGTLPAGDYIVVVDTFVSGGEALTGEYLLVVVPCEPGDSRCETPLILPGS